MKAKISKQKLTELAAHAVQCESCDKFPLDSSAQAFAMASKLRIGMYHSDNQVLVRQSNGSWHAFDIVSSGCREETMRYAIVSLAAQIGRDMKYQRGDGA